MIANQCRQMYEMFCINKDFQGILSNFNCKKILLLVSILKGFCIILKKITMYQVHEIGEPFVDYIYLHLYFHCATSRNKRILYPFDINLCCLLNE